MEEGKISEVRNCPPSNAKYEVECLLLACEKTLFDRGTIPARARIIKTQSDHKITGKPGRSTHRVKYPEQDGFRYAACEMQGTEVISVQQLTAREQGW